MGNKKLILKKEVELAHEDPFSMVFYMISAASVIMFLITAIGSIYINNTDEAAIIIGRFCPLVSAISFLLGRLCAYIFGDKRYVEVK